METIKGGRKSHTDELEETRELMNSISPSFCLAKWMQHTLYLQNGMNHSCHHPPTHKIPVEEIKNNPKALHNTQHKKKRMQQMLDGEKPSECDYCATTVGELKKKVITFLVIEYIKAKPAGRCLISMTYWKRVVKLILNPVI